MVRGVFVCTRMRACVRVCVCDIYIYREKKNDKKKSLVKVLFSLWLRLLLVTTSPSCFCYSMNGKGIYFTLKYSQPRNLILPRDINNQKTAKTKISANLSHVIARSLLCCQLQTMLSIVPVLPARRGRRKTKENKKRNPPRPGSYFCGVDILWRVLPWHFYIMRSATFTCCKKHQTKIKTGHSSSRKIRTGGREKEERRVRVEREEV